MMWGAIHYAVKLSCRDEVLIPHTLPAMNLHRDVFQHDNDRPHTARATVLILAKQNVTVLLWPFKSLDLNTKEHFVDDLDRRVRSRQPATQTLQELQQALEQERVGKFRKTVFVD